MTYAREHWYPAAWDHEVGREPLARRLLDQDVVLYRTGDGRPVALQDRCCHKLLPLSKGRLVGDDLQCGYHGMTYDPTGACVRIPGQDAIPATARVRPYPAVDHLGLVWLWFGDADRVDRAKLFHLPQFGADGWALNRGPHTTFRANYQHLTDNLLDPAHVSFVHAGSLGSPAHEDVPAETSERGETVTVRRWTLDSPPIPLLARFHDFGGNVDRWQYYHFTAPSIAMVDFGSGPPGMDHGDAARDAAIRIHSCHFIAPETARTTHYFWLQLRNFSLHDAAVSADMTEAFVGAFEEDRQILEAVQAAEERAPGAGRVSLKIDNGPNRSRRIVRRLIEAEGGLESAAD